MVLATQRLTCPDSRLFLRACHDAGFEPRIAFQRHDDYGAIMGFVAAGVGVALIHGYGRHARVREVVPLHPTAGPLTALRPIEDWCCQMPRLSLAAPGACLAFCEKISADFRFAADSASRQPALV